MLEKVLQLLSMTCRHRNTTQPFTASTAVAVNGGSWETVVAAPTHYVVCLDCGKKFTYDWNEMRIVKN
jgi:hypothetical protein